MAATASAILHDEGLMTMTPRSVTISALMKANSIPYERILMTGTATPMTFGNHVHGVSKPVVTTACRAKNDIGAIEQFIVVKQWLRARTPFDADDYAR